mmetsp:Transcript_41620/g.128581  ORF Transcript_41620/g.128581 Transcript_41620/m.128581 type:complete len:263 (-) Transcript_41620:16-804(-)
MNHGLVRELVQQRRDDVDRAVEDDNRPELRRRVELLAFVVQALQLLRHVARNGIVLVADDRGLAAAHEDVIQPRRHLARGIARRRGAEELRQIVVHLAVERERLRGAEIEVHVDEGRELVRDVRPDEAVHHGVARLAREEDVEGFVRAGVDVAHDDVDRLDRRRDEVNGVARLDGLPLDAELLDERDAVVHEVVHAHAAVEHARAVVVEDQDLVRRAHGVEHLVHDALLEVAADAVAHRQRRCGVLAAAVGLPREAHRGFLQ